MTDHDTLVDRFVEMALPITWAAIKDWNDWRLRGAPEGETYSRSDGLCNAAGRFDRTYGARCNLKAIFGEDYPFGEAEHDERFCACTQHTFPPRIAFVEAVLARKPVVDASDA